MHIFGAFFGFVYLVIFASINSFILCRASGCTHMVSGFILCILSPVWRAKLCGKVGADKRAQLHLDGDEFSAFSKVLALGCGASVLVTGELEELMALGRMADRYQIEMVQRAVEDAVLSSHLTVENCGSILVSSSGSGLVRLERASRELALREFDALARTEGFLELSEENLGSLLDDDGLVSESEELVFESLVRWMKAGAGAPPGAELRGEGLLRKIRFPYMDGLFLADGVRRMLPDDVGLDGLLLDACMLRGIPGTLWAGRELRFLDPAVLRPRRSDAGGTRGRRRAEACGCLVVCVHCRGAWGLPPVRGSEDGAGARAGSIERMEPSSSVWIRAVVQCVD